MLNDSYIKLEEVSNNNTYLKLKKYKEKYNSNIKNI